MFLSGYIYKDWMREALLVACTPYSKRHESVNIADWVMGPTH